MKKVVRSREQIDLTVDECAIGGLITGNPLMFSLEPYKPPRTLDQNAYVHVLFRELGNHLGYSEREVKAICKDQYGPTISYQVGENIVTAPKGISAYNLPELQEFIDRVLMLGAELGYVFEEQPG
jgi:hypothetical protein